jgi:uncharacterized pyridoxamine 5'-phosphate oxidase family protein
MIDFASILEKNPDGVFATQDGGKVKTRVFQYLFAEGKKVYFCTSSRKHVFAQMKANPNVSFCAYPQDFSPVLSINGRAVIVEDGALKNRILDGNPSIKSIYKSPENPLFKVFYIDVEEVKAFTYKEGSKTYSF